MSAFAIFATVLTIGYIIYYGIAISRDIIASKKADNSTVETFEVEEINHPQPTTVQETAEGFSIAPLGESEYEPLFIQPSEDVEPENESSGDKTRNVAQELVDQTNAELEPMAEASEPGFNPDGLEDAIHKTLTNATGNDPRIACTVVDETHGQEMPNTDDDADEEEIRV